MTDQDSTALTGVTASMPKFTFDLGLGDFLMMHGFGQWHSRIVETVGLDTLPDIVQYVQDPEDLSDLSEKHGMKKPAQRKLFDAIQKQRNMTNAGLDLKVHGVRASKCQVKPCVEAHVDTKCGCLESLSEESEARLLPSLRPSPPRLRKIYAEGPLITDADLSNCVLRSQPLWSAERLWPAEERVQLMVDLFPDGFLKTCNSLHAKLRKVASEDMINRSIQEGRFALAIAAQSKKPESAGMLLLDLAAGCIPLIHKLPAGWKSQVAEPFESLLTSIVSELLRYQIDGETLYAPVINNAEHFKKLALMLG